jgi:hypothetical protein
MIMSSGGQPAVYMFSDSESTLIESELVLAVLLLLLLLLLLLVSVLARVQSATVLLIAVVISSRAVYPTQKLTIVSV